MTGRRANLSGESAAPLRTSAQVNPPWYFLLWDDRAAFLPWNPREKAPLKPPPATSSVLAAPAKATASHLVPQLLDNLLILHLSAYPYQAGTTSTYLKDLLFPLPSTLAALYIPSIYPLPTPLESYFRPTNYLPSSTKYITHPATTTAIDTSSIDWDYTSGDDWI
ncbi:uncharacterized protein TrAFT101_001507 [Trichoderma asperellum]|uniref:Uncharacterized protein n=1 Tax=Trichoderma asperellum (strain ATCC 204424 / CBS 433.97 / NBRC 101777) TaxID=1042311 RepID=A0A2T3ZDQ2_TRIA4|nr:hypothetical protein M441DRAFT_25051 [Trichoderma asperellum CBS 433.97]PTB42935.1 hypothetical protein M441DRAFT_25051 [Trichoderma asperellum CBS 433.97]UKZ85656.1 hypothetical protein TrAFT101_001507 [Trichoderma asperellum]